MSYLRNYIIIALVLYGISGMKYFLQVNLLWTPWHTLKTTNLLIMHYMERLYAHVKRNLYNVPVMSTQTRYIEDIKDKMNQYGLKRDKIYCLMSCVVYNIKNIFGLSNKRNYLTIILTVLFTKRAMLVRLIVSLYHRSIYNQILAIIYKFYGLIYKLYEFIKRVNPNKMRLLGVSIVGLIVILMSIRLGFKFWNSYKKEVKISEAGEILPMTSLEELNSLQNKLGDYMIVIVNEVRSLDKLLAEKHFEGYEKLKGIKELSACQVVVEEIKNKIPEVEQVKEMQLYGTYRHKYNKYTLSLIDLSKEEASKKVLQKYQEDLTNEVACNDEMIVRGARAYLYDYLKRCMEYYNELDSYLTKVHKGKRRDRKKIYKREQLASMQLASDIIENFFES